MALASKLGLTAANTKANTLMERSTDRVFTNGLTEANTQVVGPLTRSAASAPISGPMVAFMRANGATIICTVEASILGQTVVVMRATTLMIRSMGKEPTCGLTEDHTQGAGKMESKMARESTDRLVVKSEEANGGKVSVLSGLTKHQ